ncbi:DNA-binding protein [Thiomicrorhabdus immobilis]|uniref:DNA-binding protein n=1 Tax=Thiomicrorhabdus immobilis TaxID=2791037 RepID=A0ABN6CXC5_9GAMM|nr:DnaJ domain-containing protein [Thiomicrorhabdus immobilis]BCN93264.1 DNA-binding protein [Thiomicrorhabdus immobilis]
MRVNYDVSVDYFAVLGVHYGACSKTVKLAYRKMARRYHPDVSKIHDAQSRFQDIAFAYEILSKYRDSYCHEFNLRKIRAQNVKSKVDKQTPEEPQSNPSGFTADAEQKKSSAESKAGANQQQRGSANYSAYRSQKPINGKDRVINYPLTLRYAIRLLSLGHFYIPGLKLNMKFTREAFEEKTFRLEGKGYSGLFGGKPGNFLVKFTIKIDSVRYKLLNGDIYGSFTVPKALIKPGEAIRLDVVSGKVELQIPENYSAEKFIKVDGMGLPADEVTPAGDLYVRLIAS